MNYYINPINIFKEFDNKNVNNEPDNKLIASLFDNVKDWKNNENCSNNNNNDNNI